ncbi:hypothetical protein CYY_005991 [Polysphondylium violaceum]|uniref:RRM domain-containing protein n=1 Tax=Polysphondylium violaceum TaxID=133409 RepID=A0A8J4PRK9_9MYCE|nr:hypothetical protein CYY_005991 [Polysphondylium violaceum]
MSSANQDNNNNQSSLIHQQNSEKVFNQKCTTTVKSNGIANNSNNDKLLLSQQNSHDKVDYDLCGLFKIYFPLERNFENLDIKDHDQIKTTDSSINTISAGGNEKFIPVLDCPMSWSELTDLSESLYSTSSSSSSFIDFDELSQRSSSSISSSSSSSSISSSSCSSIKVSKKPTQQNSPSNNSSGNNTIGNSKKGSKKLFIGGITFDDIKDKSDLIELRIKKIKHLFESFGKVTRFDEHWDKEYCFVTFVNPKITLHVFQSISNQNKKMKLINTIKESLIHENNDPMAAPSNTLYTKYPNNRKKK